MRDALTELKGRIQTELSETERELNGMCADEPGFDRIDEVDARASALRFAIENIDQSLLKYEDETGA